MSQLDGFVSPQQSRPRVVVIGAGFGGLNAVYGLRDVDVDVTLVDKNNFHTFQPLLYQVSTGYLSADEVGSSTRSIFRKQRNVTVRVGTVEVIDWERRTVVVDGSHLPYDYLVIATGATTNFFGIPGLAEYSWPLYSLVDAARLRSHLLSELEKSAHTDHRTTAVVVGGGPTGVEMAGALSTMGRDLINEDTMVQVVLVEALPRLLSAFSEKSASRASDSLRRLGVDVRLNTRVMAVDSGGVNLEGGERVETNTVVWAAGVQATDIGERNGLQTLKSAIVVGPDFGVEGKLGVFAIGDVSSLKPSGSAASLPQLAPAAIQGGKFVAEQIQHLVEGRPTAAFKYRDKGIMAVIGRGSAVAELPKPLRLNLGGRLAWLAWLGVHIVYLIGFRNRIKVLVDWGWNYLTSRGSNAILLPNLGDPHVSEQREQDSK